MNTRPILWHIEISHFNEKARWALDLKGVEHERRALVPGYHMAVALALTRGRCNTTPILELDGRRIGDSTAIIRALEERYPQVGEVRGRGAMCAMELVEDPHTKEPLVADTMNRIAREALERGVIVLTAGTYGNVIRLLPPLTIEETLLADGLDVLEEAVDAALR